MLRRDIRLAGDHPQGVNSVYPGMSQVNLPRVIQTVVQCFIDPVDLIVAFPGRLVSETDHIQCDRSKYLEVILTHDHFRQPFCNPDMSPNLVAKSFNTIHPDHAPELESPEPSPQRHSPVAVIVHLTPGSCPEIFRKYLESPDKICRVFNEVSRAVEPGKHPFMRIKDY